MKYLPAFAYMEYLYHNLKKENTESMVDTFPEQMNISTVPFGKDDAAEAGVDPLETGISKIMFKTF